MIMWLNRSLGQREKVNVIRLSLLEARKIEQHPQYPGKEILKKPFFSQKLL